MRMNDLPGTTGETIPANARQQLSEMVRQLNDTLVQLGVAPRLGELTDSLPDARSRLSYIATKTGEAAERVLDLVDEAKAEQIQIEAKCRHMAIAIVADPVKAALSGAVTQFVADTESAAARTDRYLTDIMIAQDFHDLTGQVVAKVVKLATEIEAQLVKLLVQTTSGDRVPSLDPTLLHGPVVNPAARPDAVANQQQVDELLGSLGF
jgi:chemotaxis protein CheZ